MSEGVSSPFCNWFRNDLIPGHCFFEPSFFVETCYQIIVSPFEEPGCDAAIDFVARAVLVLVLPIIALIAFLCLIPGLPIKALCTCFCDPSPPAPLRRAPVAVSTHPPMPKTSSTPAHVPTSSIPIPKAASTEPRAQAYIPPPNPQVVKTKPVPQNVVTKSIPHRGPSNDAPPKPKAAKKKSSTPNVATKSIPRQSQQPSNVPPPNHEENLKACLGMANQLFGNINEKVKNINLLRTIGELLDSAKHSLDILQSESGVTPGNPLDNEYAFLRGRYASIEDKWNRLKIDKHNVISVPNDGNCLFASFAVSTQNITSTPKKIRKKTVDWMHANRTNVKLQPYLLQSLAEHYGRKETNLKEEQLSITSILSDASQLLEDQMAMYIARQEKISIELEQIGKLLNVTIPKASGKAHEPINFSLVAGFVPDYLAEMACDGVHGGAAEIYALSCLSLKDASVHEYEGGKPSQKNFRVIGNNRSSERWYVAIYNIPGTRSNHYSPFIPTW